MNRKTFILFLFIAFLTILLGFATNVLSDDFDQWCIERFGIGYKSWLLAILIAGTLVALYFTTDIGKSLFSRSKETDTRPLALTPEENQKNYATIRQYLLEKRYRPRLQQKLAGDQLFNLRVKPTAIGASPEKAATFVTLQGRKTGQEIRQIFEQSRRRLLVTGMPGSGKTSLLLHLAIELLETDRENLTAVLNLATWKSDYQTFDNWLREILPAELGVTKRYPAEILQQGKLTLLLDGLDEVDETHRASCIDAIKGYGGHGRKDYVISTRKDEFKALEKDAPVWAQIEVLPLTKTQLLAQLDRADRRDFPEAPDLKAALENDPLLLEVAETPFYLNCLQLLFRGGSTLSEMNFKGERREARQAEIIERFTEQALAMRSPHGYTPEQVGRWLSFLASRLTQRNKVVFELVDLQYDWWKFMKLQLIVALFANGLTIGILGGITLGSMLWIFLFTVTFPSYNFNFALINVFILLIKYAFWGVLYGALFSGFLFVVIASLKGMPAEIKTKDKPQLSLDNIANHVKNRVDLVAIWILLIGLLVAYSIDSYGDVISSFQVVFGGLLGAFLFMFIYGANEILQKKYSYFIQIITPYQRFTASAKALHFSILQHWLLRWQLYHAGVLPLRLVDFLNEMPTRHFLETDGATWRFRHRILQEHFANQWKENRPSTPNLSLPSHP